ncbi:MULTISPECIES: TetR/AcrR family transcriptional regulator [Micrococcaceae]|jgi:AcrR family transcriptional regulator|uniref:TetR/AcrR family transcriptional regulator n=1 Tax=Micrococcaceae TaxID=1268 RepID=UPI0006FA4054|nr:MULTISPECIES: TetR/AcrR family transcriptional regulator [Micrococcaceae]KRE77801.1 TetR family transcriptional regulator [Arthrobacter sp. Soil761]MBD1591150.1 TetR/AcrR family transcriptional regulator [Arthrobacter sp. S1_S22]TQJ60739.1 TetR family transcriptional regulator [Arthrobacter sp. SLBN-83]TWD56817.1 TetR family transcriptional regulator [Arthrobacter sp. AG367]
MSYPPGYRIERERNRTEKAGDIARAKAIQAAIELFSTSGYNKSSIAEVALRTGLSQSGLLHHFPNKTALLTAVLEQREKEDSEFLFGEGAAPMGWAAFDSLVALVARNSTRPEWIGLFVRISAEATEAKHPANQWMLDHYRSTREWLTQAIEDGKRTGEILPDAPVEAIVRNTIAVLDGLQQQWVAEPHSMSMVAELRVYLDQLRATWGNSQQ